MARMQGGFFDDLPNVDSNEGRHRKTAGRKTPPAPAEQTTETDVDDMNSAAVMPSSTGVQQTVGRGRPRKDLVREGKNRGLAKGYERFTLVADSDLLTWYRDYAYTYRVSMREALETALAQFKEEHSDDELQADPKFHK